jgi:hypothetical protein
MLANLIFARKFWTFFFSLENSTLSTTLRHRFQRTTAATLNQALLTKAFD